MADTVKTVSPLHAVLIGATATVVHQGARVTGQITDTTVGSDGRTYIGVDRARVEGIWFPADEAVVVLR